MAKKQPSRKKKIVALVQAAKDAQSEQVIALLNELSADDLQLDEVRLAYIYAAAICSTAAMEAFLSKGFAVDLRNGDWTPLLSAARFANVPVVKQFLALGADPNLPAHLGNPILGVICSNLSKHPTKRYPEYAETVKLLLNAGCDPNALGPEPLFTTLEVACDISTVSHDNLIDIPLALLEHGANPNPPSKNCVGTPLGNAAMNGTPELVEALLAAGADVNRQTCDGVTPLMSAQGHHKYDHMRILLKHGADPLLKHNKAGDVLEEAVKDDDVTAMALLWPAVPAAQQSERLAVLRAQATALQSHRVLEFFQLNAGVPNS